MAKDKPRIWISKKNLDAKRPVGEKPQNREDRLRSVDTKTTRHNWEPLDTGRGIRDTKTRGRQFQQPAKPDNGR